MSLDRVYTLPDGSQVWAEHRQDSPLATVGESLDIDGVAVPPRETVTVRMRWRAGVDVNTRFTGRDGGVWFVNETAEVGRRRWLDVGLSSYPADERRSGLATPPDDGTVEGWTPPGGWPFAVGGEPLAVLTIATLRTDGPRRRRGTFVVPAGLTGEYGRPGWINFRGGQGRYLGRFRPYSEDFGDGFLDLAFYDGGSGSPTAALGDGPAGQLGDLMNAAVPLESGDRLAVLNAADNAMFEGVDGPGQ